MSQESDNKDDSTLFSPVEMRGWLKIEVMQVKLAAERRIRDAMSIVDDYAAGKLSRLEADQRLTEYENKWGEVAKDSSIAGQAHDQAISTLFGQPERENPDPTKRSR